jgi:ankyrin repeat protein
VTDSKFNLAAALETLRSTDRTALDKLLLGSAEAGNWSAVDAVHNAGADIDGNDGARRTPLHYAADNGHTAIARQLTAMGANVDGKDDGGCPRPPRRVQWPDCGVEGLIAKGAHIRVRDRWGRTAFDLATGMATARSANSCCSREALCLSTLFARR